MDRAKRRSADQSSSVPDAIARVRRQGADASDHAILVGTRAGVVEWANAAWSDITGFPLHETLDKPITHFLDVAGIELELVDFVGQHFLEGRPCTIEFPYESFEGRSLDVRLEVHPIRNDAGELDAFVAKAGIVPPRRATETPTGPPESGAQGDAHAPSAAPPKALGGTSARSAPRRERVPLSDHVRRIVESRSIRSRRRVHFDLDLAPDLPEIEVDANALDALVEALVDVALLGIDDEWGFVTLCIGRARAARGHVSKVYPIVARPLQLAAGDHLFLEVHDTGRTVSPMALARVERNDPGSDVRERALARCRRLATDLGATLHLESTPGCGSQSLVLFPIG